MDEHRMGLQPILRKVWAKRGQRPVVIVRPRYEWLYVYGFVRPETGETMGYGLGQHRDDERDSGRVCARAGLGHRSRDRLGIGSSGLAHKRSSCGAGKALSSVLAQSQSRVTRSICGHY